jgi:hypothetical protein
MGGRPSFSVFPLSSAESAVGPEDVPRSFIFESLLIQHTAFRPTLRLLGCRHSVGALAQTRTGAR